MHIRFLDYTPLFALFLFFSASLPAQKSDREVTRCSAADRSKAVWNICVDAENKKWVSSEGSVVQIKACDLGEPLGMNAGEQSALAFAGGNADRRWSQEALLALIKTPVEISAAYYDDSRDMLWIGTKASGLFLFKTKPQLLLSEKITSGNSKLPSNEITTITKDIGSRFWIGTASGMLTGTPGKWRVELDGYQIKRTRTQGADIYVLADNELWQAKGGNDWDEVNIPAKALEGDPVDFDFDLDGALWLLSGVAAVYEAAAGNVRTFGPSEYYTSEYGTCITADLDGAIWVGTQDKGVFVIEKTSNLTVNCVVEKTLSCNGNGKDAVISVKVSGGAGPFRYQWSGGLQGANPQNVGMGSYTVTVTDQNGKTKIAKADILDPLPQATAKQIKIESAPGKADGAAEVTASGGSSPYKYQWSNGETGKQAQKLSEGVYTVTVSDQKSCSAVATVSIGQNILPLVVRLEETGKIDCNGGQSALKVAVEGGKAPFKYQWSVSAGAGEQASNLPAGAYSVTVSDAAGGSASAQFSVKQPDALSASVSILAPASTGNSDGKAQAQGKGGTPPYAFAWSNGSAVADAAQLAPGAYSVTITDAKGCTAGATVAITENILPLAVSIEEIGSINCNGGRSSLKVKVSGGKGPFKYAWSATDLSGAQPTGVLAGDYQVSVSDAAGGSAVGKYNVKQPVAMTATISVKSPAIAGNANGVAVVNMQGGFPPYSYAWDTKENSEEAQKLSPGTHSVTITDNNGCAATASVQITESILPLSAAIEETGKILCNGGQSGLKVNVKGGKGSYQYAWNKSDLSGAQVSNLLAGEYQVTVTDGTGGSVVATSTIKEPLALVITAVVKSPASVDKADGRAFIQVKGGRPPYNYAWDSGETNSEAQKLTAGKHTVTVTDIYQCTGSISVQINENIPPLTASITERDRINCNGGLSKLQVTVAGGKPPYQLKWSAENIQGEQPDNAPAGDYQLTITDAGGGTVVAQYKVKEPLALTAVATVQTPASTGGADGKAIVTVEGGKPPYKFAWDSGETTAEAAKLGPGAHQVTITDASRCKTVATADINETILPLELTLEPLGAIRCAGERIGIKANVKGGKPPFKYQWNYANAAGDQLGNVPPGNYTLSVTDAKGTTQTAAVSVKGPDSLLLSIKRKTGATTERSKDGKATVVVAGGVQPYVAAWDNAETALSASKLTFGLHTVKVSDANGCAASATVDIGLRILPELTAGALQSGQTIRMEQLQFEADSSRLTESCFPILNELYDFLEENGNIVIEIGGHSNSNASDAFADKISAARAQSAADYLIGKGINPKRVSSKGYGKRNPVATNATPEGRKKNQRVEIKILKVQ